MKSTEPSTGPGSKASLAALQAQHATIVAWLRDLDHPFARDAAAALSEAIDPRPYSQRIEEAIRAALGTWEPDRFGAAAYVRSRIELFGPGHFGLRRTPDVETIAERLRTESTRRKARLCALNAETAWPSTVHIAAAGEHAVSTYSTTARSTL